MKQRTLGFPLISVFILVLAACTGASQPAPPAAPAKSEPAPASKAAPAADAAKPAAQASPAAAAPASSKPAEKITIRFRQSFVPNADYPPYLVAKEKGYYADEGIEFENLVGSGSGNAVKLVGTGENPLALADAANVLQGTEQGIPIVAVADIYRDTTTGVFTLKESGLTSIEQLKGKTVGETINAAGFVMFKAALKEKGMSLDDVRFVNLEPAAKNNALMQKQVDAIVGFYNEQPPVIEARNFQLNEIRFEDILPPVVSKSIIVNKEFLEKNPRVVEGFIRATLKGYQYTDQNLDEAMQIFAKAYPDAEVDVTKEKYVRLRPAIWTKDLAQGDLGKVEPERWQNLYKALREFEVLGRDFDVATSYNVTPWQASLRK